MKKAKQHGLCVYLLRGGPLDGQINTSEGLGVNYEMRAFAERGKPRWIRHVYEFSDCKSVGRVTIINAKYARSTGGFNNIRCRSDGSKLPVGHNRKKRKAGKKVVA